MLEVVQDALAVRSAAPPALVSAQAVPLVARVRPLIVAVDGPSGLDFDTGEIDDLALSADLTVTFAMPKWGHVLLPGAGRIGELIVANIGIPEGLDVSDGPHLATPTMIGAWLPKRPIDAHKGTFGKAMLVAGSANYTGAAVLASTGAIRTGAGLVTLALPSVLHSAVVPAIPEVTYLLLPHTLGVLNEHAVDVLRENLAGYSALLIGPGLGNTSETRAFFDQLLYAKKRKRSAGFITSGGDDAENDDLPELPPLVIDADGLNVLSSMEDWPHRLPTGTILTPHPGEMARLTGMSTKAVQADRLATARSWAATWHQVIVLKGAFTVIAAPEREPVILPFANPGLSSAGTGDVLAGAIVALRAQGLGAFEAAVAGAYLHGLAGALATAKWGIAGTAARDVAQALADAYRRLME
jgi:NAD(P)H-hydrate epimerase